MQVDQAKCLKALEKENIRLKRLGVKPLYIEPVNPWENGYIESFKGKLQNKVLNQEVFDTLQEAKVLVER